MNEWINVKDRLPKNFGRYLVCCEYSPPWIGVSTFRGEVFDDTNVSHWMPIPTPPEAIK